MTESAEPPAALTLDRVVLTLARVAGRRSGDAGSVTVLDDVSLQVRVGECVGVVAGHDAGVGALVRVAGGVREPTRGSVTVAPSGDGVQVVLREAEQGVDPRTTVEAQVGWLAADVTTDVAVQRRARTLDALVTVGLDPEGVDRPVRALPLVDQRRVLLARAAAATPSVLVLEDVTAGLGPSDRGQLLDAVADLRRGMVPTILVADPDVAFVTALADRLAVLHRARLVEIGPSVRIAGASAHPYTRALFDALPVPRPRSDASDRHRPRPVLEGPPPAGCRFHPSCWLADDRCVAGRPPLEPKGDDGGEHLVACFHPLS